MAVTGFYTHHTILLLLSDHVSRPGPVSPEMRKQKIFEGGNPERGISLSQNEGTRQMIRVTRCTACDGSGKEDAPPGIHKKCQYCRGTGWVEFREIIHYGK
jgi:hypothetical protein